MTGKTARQYLSWVLSSLLAVNLALTAGCAGKAATARGSSCYSKALPTSGEGGLAWGATLDVAQKESMDNCMRYAGRSGGTPNTCHVVVSECKN
jgi:hypothetical protein